MLTYLRTQNLQKISISDLERLVNSDDETDDLEVHLKKP